MYCTHLIYTASFAVFHDIQSGPDVGYTYTLFFSGRCNVGRQVRNSANNIIALPKQTTQSICSSNLNRKALPLRKTHTNR